ncbi:response regulator transcription factor [TM7 phylum sp. oral taxon 351]|jgi:DNA-binding response regulator vncR|nr:response regulator transcription factor [TM7 phylum sp. oral taxon 351]
MKILIVEDDRMIREGVVEFLREFKYEMVEAGDGLEALKKFNHEINLVILDIKLPSMSGLEVLRKIREKSRVPVLMMTAFSDEESQIMAFSNLADGFMEKPFSLPVLKARVEALLKKTLGEDLREFSYQETKIDFVSFRAEIAGQAVEVKPKELEILKYLFLNEGRVLKREQIIENVWKESEEIPFDRVIDVYIKELRKKLKLDCIYTVRGVGYKLERE